MALHLSSKRWQDQVILLIGVWLFASPWVFGYDSSSASATNAYATGLVMAVLAVFDLYKTYMWAVLLNVVVGIWTAVSPWLIEITYDRAMTASLLLSGMATVVLGLWELRSDPELHRQWTKSRVAG